MILSGAIPGNKQSLLHVKHATKQSVVTVKELMENVLHLIKKIYIHLCKTGFVRFVFKVFYLFIK